MSIWPFKPNTSKQIARIEIAGAMVSIGWAVKKMLGAGQQS